MPLEAPALHCPPQPHAGPGAPGKASLQRHAWPAAHLDGIDVLLGVALALLHLLLVAVALLQEFLGKCVGVSSGAVSTGQATRAHPGPGSTFSCSSCSRTVLLSVMGTAWIFSCRCLASWIHWSSPSQLSR